MTSESEECKQQEEWPIKILQHCFILNVALFLVICPIADEILCVGNDGHTQCMGHCTRYYGLTTYIEFILLSYTLTYFDGVLT